MLLLLSVPTGEVEVDGAPIHVTLCDTAGQDTLDALRELCYPGSDVFMVCFSVVNPDTFRSVQAKWIPKLAKVLRTASVILVGTHADLRNDQSTIARLQVFYGLRLFTKRSVNVG